MVVVSEAVCVGTDGIVTSGSLPQAVSVWIAGIQSLSCACSGRIKSTIIRLNMVNNFLTVTEVGGYF